MNIKTTVIAVAGLVAVLGLLIAPLSLSDASAKLTLRCDGEPDPDGCPGASGTKGQGHDEELCNDSNCPPGRNKD